MLRLIIVKKKANKIGNLLNDFDKICEALWADLDLEDGIDLVAKS